MLPYVTTNTNLLSSPVQARCLTSLTRIKVFQSLLILSKHADFLLLVCFYGFLFCLRDLGRQFSWILFILSNSIFFPVLLKFCVSLLMMCQGFLDIIGSSVLMPHSLIVELFILSRLSIFPPILCNWCLFQGCFQLLQVLCELTVLFLV